MNWTIIIIETAALVLLFTAAIMIPLVKNPVWWIHDYPRDIQERYFETHDRHLCFRVGICCSQPVDGWQDASVTTVVKFNNFLGRIYFIGIWVFHKLLVKSLFRKAINK